MDPNLSEKYLDIFKRYFEVLPTDLTTYVVVLVFAAVLTLPVFRRGPWKLSPFESSIFHWAVVAVAIVLVLRWSMSMAWIGDDAFISFRYADMLARGEGLVFNPGEKVEGFTNFLWTVLMVPFIWFGIHPAQASIVLSLAALGGVIVGLARYSLLLRQRTDVSRSLEPRGLPGLAPMLGVSSYALANFGTSGLETMLGVCLVLWAVERAENSRLGWAGWLAILATINRPDHAVFYVALGVALVWQGHRVKALIPYALPFAFLYLPYFVGRYLYYGEVFPNTYFTKSGGETYFEQGGIYLWTLFWGAGIFAILPLVLLGGVVRRGSVLAKFSVIGLPLFLLYVAKVGGGFMWSRLALSTLPFFFLLAELGVAWFWVKR